MSRPSQVAGLARWMVLAAGMAVVLGVGPAASAQEQAKRPAMFPYRYHQAVLPNGLTVVMIPMESPGLVAYYTVVRTGSRDEVEPGRSGFAHFFEHMMFRGTKKYPGPVYDRIVTSLGADANAFTSDDVTAYYLVFAKDDLPRVVEIESDRFQNLHYEEPAFQTEAGAVYGEYRKNITHPFALLNEKLRDLAFDVHTYKHTTIGFEADIQRMPELYEHSLWFFRRYYRPDNVVLLIVGDIEPEATLALVREAYGGWEAGYVAPEVPVEPPQTAERYADVSYPGRTLPILDMAYKGDAFDPDNPTFVAATLLAELAFGQTSALYKRLVLREQKVEMLTAYVPMRRDPPLYQILAMIKSAEDIGYVRGAIEQTLQEFQARPVEATRLEQLKRREKYAFLMSLDSPHHVAEQLVPFVALTGSIDAVDRFYAALQRVTPEQIQEAANRYFVPQRRTTIVLKGAGS